MEVRNPIFFESPAELREWLLAHHDRETELWIGFHKKATGRPTLSYQEALISAMREAPDLIMIGEIRDQTTLVNALLFAQTGHLCMSTLHANNRYNALNRIINFFPRDQRDAVVAHAITTGLLAAVGMSTGYWTG